MRSDFVELALQFGYGMKKITSELSQKWGDTSVILSPRDMSPSQFYNWSNEFNSQGIHCYFDPQCYCPKSDNKHLPEYDYWDNHFTTLLDNRNPFDSMLSAIREYNDTANACNYILPCILNEYGNDWLSVFNKRLGQIVDSANTILNDKPLLATAALPKELLLQKEEELEALIDIMCNANVSGYYLIAEVPEKKYLVDNPIWLYNVLKICAALKIAGKKVIYGYGNHQMLALSLTGIDAMASGTWLNVRSFTNRFVDSKQTMRKSTWVYYPIALSEYKMTFMDWAYSNDLLYTMKATDNLFYNEYTKTIIEADVSPSTTGFNESDAFKHYLCCLRQQVESLNKPSYSDTFNSYQMMLTTAERELERLERSGMYAQARSFRDVIDVNRAAISQLDNGYGFSLKMSW